MNKTAIKNFAVWARRELISRVSQKALQYGISETECVSATADSVNGHVLSATEKKQRSVLIARIHRSGYTQTMEEIAYTWFNRFCALRFMEVNGYLPSLVRVFTDENGEFRPQILADAIHLELEGLDRDKVLALKEANKSEELYKYLLITQCNALNAILPGMFQKIEDETELLFPDNLLREESVVAHLIHDIPEEDWQDAVQIIGWLYQYYNSEPKDQVFANLKKNIKITKENIPAATQLFTPDWIVRYMVENSLGRIYINTILGKWTGSEADRQQHEKTIADRHGWKYYLPEAEQTPEVRAALKQIETDSNPEKLKVIDPCMGSGHILVYMFDVLMQIYRACGYDDRTAVTGIVSNNLFGLDIDDRAAQLAYFAVMMKARQYDRGFFRRGLQPKVYSVCQSNDVTPTYVDYFCKGNNRLAQETHRMITELHDAKEYGSILNITPADFSAMYARLNELEGESELEAVGAAVELRPLIQCAEALAQRYDAVVTNPPYMGSGGMSEKLSDFVKAHYPDTKSDLSTVFMEKTLSMCKPYGYMAMINIPVWMFLSSYESLRISIIENNTFVNMAHCGRGIFGSDFGTTSFIIAKAHIDSYKGSYRRLFNKNVEVDSVETKERWFLEGKGAHLFVQEKFELIPGSPIAYWVSDKFITIFNNQKLGEIAAPRQGVATADNNRFLRLWYECEITNCEFACDSHAHAFNSGKKWFPYNKGGEFRKWYGNNDFLVNWALDGRELRDFEKSVIRNPNYFFKECITWSKISSGSIAFRYKPQGHIFDVAGTSIFVDSDVLNYLHGFCNSKITLAIANVISPTLNYEVGHIASLPIIFDASQKQRIDELVLSNIEFSQRDWDSFETSWDFQSSPLIEANQHSQTPGTISGAYFQLRTWWQNQSEEMRRLEVENNRIFIEVYGLQEELSPEVPWNEITLTCNPWYRYGKSPSTSEDGLWTVDSEDCHIGETWVVGQQGTAHVSLSNGRIPASKMPFNRELETRLLQDTIKELLSYAVGCMFGRYSLDVDGLAYAGGDWDASKYTTFPADPDNIIPICDDEYFEDDLTGRFVKFIEKVYGAETLEENLNFIANALGGGRGSAREIIRRYFRNDFFADHCKVYQKRPIYWLFDSGKRGGFRALIYMHRYQPSTLATLRTDYVHEQQERYRTAIADLAPRVDNASGSEKVKLSKQLAALREQAEETRLYEEKIHHLADQMISIDLDDGVKHNYAIFQDVLAKIR